MQQNHGAPINPCVLWRNWREKENRISSGCSPAVSPCHGGCPSICVCPPRQGNATLAQLTIAIYSAYEEASPRPQAFLACRLPFHGGSYGVSLRTHHCCSRGPTSDGGLSQVLSRDPTLGKEGRASPSQGPLPGSIPFHRLPCLEWPDGHLYPLHLRQALFSIAVKTMCLCSNTPRGHNCLWHEFQTLRSPILDSAALQTLTSSLGFCCFLPSLRAAVEELAPWSNAG